MIAVIAPFPKPPMARMELVGSSTAPFFRIRFPTRGQGRTDVLQMEISVSSATLEGESWKSFETALIVVWTCFLCYTKLCVEYL